MTLPTEFYSRKSFIVEAIQVTEENLQEVAAWCEGEVLTTFRPQKGSDEKESVDFVKVKVINRARNDRQTRAYPGDWLLLSEVGFKVYTDRAFKNAFEDMQGVAVYRNAETGRFDVEGDADANPSTMLAMML